ncbi:MAG: DUF1566 domain-containing protein [Desulfococcaceae bacterium]
MKKHVFVIPAVILLVFSAQTILAAGLSDTGQTKCYNDSAEIDCQLPETDTYYGQDARYNYVPRYFTKLNADGSVWTEGDHVMVRDNVTGLIWAVETGFFSWDYAEAYCDGLEIGEYKDWRMPTVKELRSIADYESSPLINAEYFPNAQAAPHWSSDKLFGDSTDAYRWYFDFAYGTSGTTNKSPDLYIYYYVRAVHCSEADYLFPPEYSSPIKDNGDGTATDIRTGLMWQQFWPTEQTEMHWGEALAYCNDLPLAGFDDWRLPNIRELGSIVSLNTANPSLLPNIKAASYWSSTTVWTFAKKPEVAVGIYFATGSDTSSDKDHDWEKRYVIAVRGGDYGTFAAKADLNKDSRVNLADAILSLQICGGLSPAIDMTFGMANIDIDADLKIGMPEVIYILQEVAGMYRCL